MEMEQYAQYLMWMKSKDLIMNSFNHSSSWEEQAFAEDARGPLGGFVWPPRSYPCSFCKREFRSAQALGGHMNVHRRERARLKQSHHIPKSPQSTLSSKSFESASNPSFVIASSSLSGSRLSPILGQQENAGSSVLDSHDHDDVETNLFVGAWNLDFPAGNSLNKVGVDEEIVATCKRQKTAVLSLMTSSAVEGIDLELRLGDSQKVS